jgi:hypothetical protein
MKPYNLVTDNEGNIVETISYSWTEDDVEWVMIRIPGNPTSIHSGLAIKFHLLMVECQQDETKWQPKVEGEYNQAHIDCPTCHRGYYADYDDDRFLNTFTTHQKLILKKLD